MVPQGTERGSPAGFACYASAAVSNAPTQWLRAASLLALSGAFACGDAPLLGRDGGHDAARAPVDAGVDAGSVPFVQVTLRRRQTLWDVARQYGVTVRELREFNDLTPWEAKHVHAGQVIRVPGVEEPVEELEALTDAGTSDFEFELEDAGAPLTDEGDAGAVESLEGGYHTLAEGETLWVVARSYDRTLDQILRANQWDDDDARGLVAGTRVMIPGVPQSRIRETRRPDAPRPRGWGIHHQMARGETIWTLAQRYGVSVAEIMAANRLSASEAQNLTLGRSVLVPGVLSRPDASQPERPISPTQERALRTARRLGLGHRTAAQQLLHGRVQPRWVAAAGGRRNQLPGTLRWPVVNGRFSRGYGSGAGGYHLAVDIMGDIGWNVRAAAPGIVGYSGRELSGFGNVVLVVHPGGWVTLYGHNSVNFVVAGQRVRAGTILAEVGSTGRSTGPHVHFELIHEGMNCNPAGLFRPGVRHRSGWGRVTQVSWTDPDDRPSAIQCAPRRRHPASDLPANE